MLSLEVVVGDDGLRVAGAVCVDEVDGLVHAADGADGQNVIVVLCVPVALVGGLCAAAQNGKGFLVAAQLHVVLVQQGNGLGQERLGHVLVDQ